MQTMNRETWLNEMAALMAPRFEELGHTIPPFRVAVGFTSAGKTKKIGGECWHSNNSADKRFEILISPVQDDSNTIAGVLAHELIHAAVGFKCGHRGNFEKMALALGLNRPMTATTPGPAFIEWVAPFVAKLGQLPHAKLSWRDDHGAAQAEDGEGSGLDDEKPSSNAKKKQKTRLIKACCAECGYTVRVTSRWLEIGPPHCPVHGAMDTEGEADE
jgi:hypothetical protein